MRALRALRAAPLAGWLALAVLPADSREKKRKREEKLCRKEKSDKDFSIFSRRISRRCDLAFFLLRRRRRRRRKRQYSLLEYGTRGTAGTISEAMPADEFVRIQREDGGRKPSLQPP
ncbi:PREDICTED: uncharacterized protein LOC108763569 [Trachymyrmex cornetzi]|uniref:uncharacterized protein LOC108763569 n=1 Tax=Trachymyrmex cornetzi TaxID=471704 RepID=UPI00084ED6D7|nr:PREDICTED: uncharacterized protein LOC108763569 [Trachymyrmex cornetzi]